MVSCLKTSKAKLTVNFPNNELTVFSSVYSICIIDTLTAITTQQLFVKLFICITCSKHKLLLLNVFADTPYVDSLIAEEIHTIL